MTFYYPNGDVITGKNSPEKFVDFYSKVYSYEFRDLALEQTIKGILTKEGDLSTENVVDILRWKIGTTNFDINTVTTRYGITINAKQLRTEMESAKKMIKPECAGCTKFTKCRKCAVCDILATLLRKENGKKKHTGISHVYAITLLHFLSKGAFPIYDKFAHIAIKVILDKERNFYSPLITDKDLSKEFKVGSVEKVFESYQNYIGCLCEVFKDDYKKVDTDRALWVYGHLFHATKANQQRIRPKGNT